MVGLLQTQQVECLWNDRHYRVKSVVNLSVNLCSRN